MYGQKLVNDFYELRISRKEAQWGLQLVSPHEFDICAFWYKFYGEALTLMVCQLSSWNLSIGQLNSWNLSTGQLSSWTLSTASIWIIVSEKLNLMTLHTSFVGKRHKGPTDITGGGSWGIPTEGG